MSLVYVLCQKKCMTKIVYFSTGCPQKIPLGEFFLRHWKFNIVCFADEENAKSTISETSQPAAPKRNSKSFPASVNGTSGSNLRPTKLQTKTKVNGHQQDTTESKTANTSVYGDKTSKTRLNETQTSIVKNPQSPQTSSAETQPVSPPTRKTYKKVKKIPVSSE